MSREAIHSESPDRSRRDRRDTALYVVIAIVLVALLVAGIVAYRNRRQTREAEAKAATLIQSFKAAGLPTPVSQKSVAAVLGTDGGAVCEGPTKPLTQALLSISLSNGAGTVGMRPVVVDATTLRGEQLILKTYCPEQLPAFEKYVKEQKFEDVIKR